jgi:PIN domain nuclease of toxin-antitoxin system
VNKSVLDAAAFLAYLRDETGAEIVENALINGCYNRKPRTRKISWALD